MAQFGNCPGGPNDSDLRLELLGKIKKVFILADNDALLKFGVAANVAVEGVPKPASSTCWQSNPRLRRYWERAVGS